MVFTWSFLGLTFLVSAVLFFSPSGWLAVGSFGLLALSWGLDLLMVRDKTVSGQRMVVSPLYQHQPSLVEIQMCNPWRRQVTVWVKDEPPFEVNASNRPGKVVIPPGKTVIFSYEIIPPQRGIFTFGAINLRYTGPWGLYLRQTRLVTEQRLAVYPDLTKVGEESLAVLTGVQREGSHPYQRLGLGGELAQLREYNPGDDYRKINWKVTAHTGKLTLNQYRPEKDQNVFLVLDSGRMLYDQNNQGQSRFDAMLDSVLLLAYNIVQRGDMVGALSFAQRVERYIPPGKGVAQVRFLVQRLFDIQAVMSESNYREAFHLLQQKLNKRSLLFVYTDFTDQESSKELIGYLRILTRRHLVVCVLFAKEYLREIAARPLVTEEDAYLKAISIELINERERLKQNLANFGIKTLEVNPGSVKRVVVEHYLFLKRKGLF